MGPLGFPELIIIFVVALLVFGPRKLPELGRSLGKGLSEFKRASNDLRQTLDEEIRDEERRTALTTPARHRASVSHPSPERRGGRGRRTETPRRARDRRAWTQPGIASGPPATCMTTNASDLDSLASDRDVAGGRRRSLHSRGWVSSITWMSCGVASCIRSMCWLPAAWSRSSTGSGCTATTSQYFGEHGGESGVQQADGRFHVQPEAVGAGGSDRRGAVHFRAGLAVRCAGALPREKRVVLPFVFFSSLLFFSGAYFAHGSRFPRCGASSPATRSRASASADDRRDVRAVREGGARSRAWCSRCRCSCSFWRGSAS